MNKRCARGLLAAVVLFGFVALGGEKSFGWPSLPGIPSVKQATKGVVSNELLKEYGTWFNYNRPVYVSGNDVLPTVSTLPGGPFHPVSQATIRKLFKPSRSPVVYLPPGDYNIAVVTYCMGHNNQGPWRNKFLLAPVKGLWSDILAALNYRATGSRFAAPQIQRLSWAMQAGMSYDEMSAESRQVVDALLPDYKPRLREDFYDRARDEWNALASKVPGAPSFDAALSQLGDVGRALNDIQTARDQIIADGNDYNAMVAQFAHLGSLRPADVLAATPWSIIAPGVYARLRTRGTFLTQGVVQLRVTVTAAYQSMQVASTQLQGIGKQVAVGFGFPFTNWAGFLNGFTQPLSWSEEPNSVPDPFESSASENNNPSNHPNPPNPGQPPNGSSNPNNNNNNNSNNNNPNNGNNASNNNNNNNSNNDNNDNNPDNNDNGNNSGGGSNPGNGGGVHNVVSSRAGQTQVNLADPCDPPGNTFGVQDGSVNASTTTSLTLGRGSGKGMVCLLLRPYADLTAAGWPGGGTGSVTDGNASNKLPWSPTVQPGHVVVDARYAIAGCLTPLFPRGPVPPCTVTAVIDYAGVGTYCPELAATMGKAPPLVANPVNWLSGASLENRLCITGMIGPQISVRAWLLPGAAPSSSAVPQPVDPQDFLYNDAWGHM